MSVGARVRRAGVVGLAFLFVVGVLFMTAAAMFVVMQSAAVPRSALGRFRYPDAIEAALARFRLPVALAFARRFGTSLRPAHVRAFFALMVTNELRADWDGVSPVIGDETLAGGPSVGPCQVYRSTAKDLGLWTPPPDVASDDAWEREVYAQVANDEARCLDWGVAVLKAKLAAAGGDLADAVRRYNGAGPKAEAYRDRVLAFADATWGGLS